MNNTFGENVKQRRLEVGLPIDHLAKRAGISRPHLSRIEAGLREPGLSIALAIADALGADVRELTRAESNSNTAKKSRQRKPRGASRA